MADAPGRIVTAGGVFAGTNIDALIVSTVLLLSARAGGKPRSASSGSGNMPGAACWSRSRWSPLSA